MKISMLGALALSLLITAGAYAQDSTTDRTERKADVKEDQTNAGRETSALKQDIKRKAKVAGEAVDKTTKKIGETVNRGLDKAENAIVTEGDKLKAKRDSSKAAKARRDSL